MEECYKTYTCFILVTRHGFTVAGFVHGDQRSRVDIIWLMPDQTASSGGLHSSGAATFVDVPPAQNSHPTLRYRKNFSRRELVQSALIYQRSKMAFRCIRRGVALCLRSFLSHLSALSTLQVKLMFARMSSYLISIIIFS